MVEVSILIVSWNSSGVISECLESIKSYSKGCCYEIIVVDNGSRDRTAEIIEKQFPEVRLIKCDRNLGFSPAMNIAISMARGQYILILNPDTRFENNVLFQLKEFCTKHPDAGGIGPKMLNEDRTLNIFAARQLPTLSGAFFLHFGLRKLFPDSRIFGKETMGGWDHSIIRRVPYINGAAIMIPKYVIDEVGFLDEEIPMYFEDLDICMRIQLAGKRLYYLPNAVLVHLKEKSSEISSFRPLLFAMENGQAPWMFFKKYRTRWHALALTVIIGIGNLLRLSILLPWLMALGRKSEQKRDNVRKLITKAWALLIWVLSRKKHFHKRIEEIFRDKNEAHFIIGWADEMGKNCFNYLEIQDRFLLGGRKAGGRE